MKIEEKGNVEARKYARGTEHVQLNAEAATADEIIESIRFMSYHAGYTDGIRIGLKAALDRYYEQSGEDYDLVIMQILSGERDLPEIAEEDTKKRSNLKGVKGRGKKNLLKKPGLLLDCV